MQNSDIPSITDYQPLNPYTEIQIISHDKSITRLLIKLDEARCASSDDSCNIFIWNINNGICIHTLAGHNRPVTCMNTISSGGDSESVSLLLLTAASDRNLFIWNVDIGKCVAQISDDVGPIRCLLPVEELTLFCTGGEKLCLWDYFGNLKCLYDQTDVEDIQVMLFMNEDLLVTAADMHLMSYAISDDNEEDSSQSLCFKSEQRFQSHRECIKCLAKVNNMVFVSGSLDGAIRIWQLPSLTCLKELNHVADYLGSYKEFPYSIQHILCLSERYIFAAVGSGFMVYDTFTFEKIACQKSAHYSKILHLCFIYNGKFMATCSEDGTIRLWNFINEPSSKSHIEHTNENISYFFYNSVDMKNSKFDIKPKLVGDCLAHSGAVEMCIDYGMNGFISCGMDSLLIAWKDSKFEDEKRDDLFIKKIYS